MNSFKLTNLEIKYGWLCKEGVKLTDKFKINEKIFVFKYPHKVKSATIWTKVRLTEEYNFYLGNPEVLEAISQDQSAYCTDLIIEENE